MKLLFKIIGFVHTLLVCLAAPEFSEFECKCSVIVAESRRTEIPTCIAALFSPSGHDTTGSLLFVPSDDGCNSLGSATSRYSSTIRAVHRGGCSFEQKTRTAVEQGFKGLIIINSENKAFPMGASDTGFVSPIPVVMVDNDVLPSMLTLYEREEKSLQLKVVLTRHAKRRKGDKLPTLHEQLIEHMPVLKTELLVALVLSLLVFFYTYSRNNRSYERMPTVSSMKTLVFQGVSWLLTFGVLIIVFTAFRMGTVRLLDEIPSYEAAGLDYPLLHGYHHTETDEMIFETLIRAVHLDPADYTLQHKPLLRILSLPKENYDHPLFIHPPFFVYASSFFHYQWHIPLPLIPIVFQVATLLCIPFLLRALLPHFSYPDLLQASLRTGWMYAICPLTWFCSQKVWIDNALLFTCTFALTVHLSLLPSQLSLPPADVASPSGTISTNKMNSFHTSGFWILKHAISGIVYGSLALNTKITALACLPVMVIWTVIQGVARHIEATHQQDTAVRKLLIGQRKKEESDNGRSGAVVPENADLNKYWYGKIAETFTSVVVFCIAAVVGHWPWLQWYHEKTGRWMPSAWPSADMLAQSSFVRTAVTQRPWYFYLQQCSQIMPLYVIALLAGLGALVITLYSISHSLLIANEQKKDTSTDIGDDATAAAQISRNEFKASTSKDRINNHIQVVWAMMAFLVVYILVFVLGMTLLGVLGAGFQTRFILPISPIVAIIVSLLLHILTNKETKETMVVNIWLEQVIYMVMAFSAVTGWYYAVQYPTRYADLDVSLWEMLQTIISVPMDTATYRVLHDDASQEQQLAWMTLLQTHGYAKQ